MHYNWLSALLPSMHNQGILIFTGFYFQYCSTLLSWLVWFSYWTRKFSTILHLHSWPIRRNGLPFNLALSLQEVQYAIRCVQSWYQNWTKQRGCGLVSWSIWHMCLLMKLCFIAETDPKFQVRGARDKPKIKKIQMHIHILLTNY